jgi:large subunit ribosomal protein L6
MAKTADIKEELTIPDGVHITIEGKNVHTKGPKGAMSKLLAHPKLTLAVNGNVVSISCSQSPHRKEKALVGTYKAHIRNMIKGVTTGYETKMKTVFSHFPIKNSVEGNQLVIQNFLGERSPRRAEILPDVTVEVKAESITVSGVDKEKVGQTAANIERATKVRNRDIRVFQDGIYVIKRG